LQKGTFHPINVFVSPDATQIYIVTTDQGILVYSLSTQSVSAIPLLNNASPVAADMTADGTLIYVAGSDGLVHQINTALAADQPSPIFFSQLPDSSNNFCYMNYSCTLNILAVKP
jgi:DNA-binding beta-propeller fold protein YncE